MEPRSLLLMMAVFLPLMIVLKRDYQRGVILAVALMVALPNSLRVSFDGGIPELTIQRLILLGLLLSYVVLRRRRSRFRTPFLAALLFLAAAQVVSLCLSVHKDASVKSFSAFALEIVTYYVVVSKSIVDRKEVLALLQVLVRALSVVAVIAVIERRLGFNLSHYLISGDGAASVDTVATYPHRIILGYAMAMGVPITLALLEREKEWSKRRLLWGALLLTMAGCYFSNSRGPWSGLIAVMIPMVIMGSRAIRKKLWFAALFAVLVLAFRPGVRETLIRAVESTIQTDSLKGKSYEYRWKLWNVAFSEISKSPERTLFGYGGLSTEKMDLGHYFQAESGGTTGALGYTSWDNQFACNLIEFGFVGFLIEFTLMIAVLLKLFSNWWRCRGPDRGLLLAFLSSCTIYVYALSNVYIFSPQLKCLFWALVACGLRFGADALRQDRDPTGVRKTANDRGRRRSVPHSGTPSFA